jgi:periplasmic protein TonB
VASIDNTNSKMTEQSSLRYLSRTVWAFAALGAVLVHAGCLSLALGAWQPDETDDDLGAPAIEIDVELASPRAESTDLPVGPNTEASAASPEVAAQKPVVDKTDLPKALPTDTDNPYRQVSPVDAKKATQDPKVVTTPALPSEQSVASLATAVPSVEKSVESSRSTAPALGTGQSANRARVTWQKELLAHFDKYKRYPSERSVQGAEVVVSFVLDRMGHVLSERIDTGSGDPAFDDAALAMLKRADPVPPPPPLVADDGLTFTLPVIFHAKGKK